MTKTTWVDQRPTGPLACRVNQFSNCSDWLIGRLKWLPLFIRAVLSLTASSSPEINRVRVGKFWHQFWWHTRPNSKQSSDMHMQTWFLARVSEKEAPLQALYRMTFPAPTRPFKGGRRHGPFRNCEETEDLNSNSCGVYYVRDRQWPRAAERNFATLDRTVAGVPKLATPFLSVFSGGG